MKAILEFDLPTDEEQFNNATRGGDWKLFAWQLDKWMRSNIKYAPDNQNADYTNALVIAREKLYELLNENNLKL